jgi:hypothetical protein
MAPLKVNALAYQARCGGSGKFDEMQPVAIEVPCNELYRSKDSD